jgi:hypothetical protein
MLVYNVSCLIIAYKRFEWNKLFLQIRKMEVWFLAPSGSSLPEFCPFQQYDGIPENSNLECFFSIEGMLYDIHVY